MGGVQSYFKQFQLCILNIFQQKQLFSLELLSWINVGAGTMVLARMTSSNKHLNVPPVYHQQKCLINGICRIFYMKSNHFVQLYLKSLKSFEKLDKMAIKCKKKCFYKLIKNCIAMTESLDGGVFEVSSICSLLAMTSGQTKYQICLKILENGIHYHKTFV